jgi:hypothetical protein
MKQFTKPTKILKVYINLNVNFVIVKNNATTIDKFTGANQLFDIPDDLKSVVSEHWAQFPPQESTFYSLNQCNGQMPPPYLHQFV